MTPDEGSHWAASTVLPKPVGAWITVRTGVPASSDDRMEPRKRSRASACLGRRVNRLMRQLRRHGSVYSTTILSMLSIPFRATTARRAGTWQSPATRYFQIVPTGTICRATVCPTTFILANFASLNVRRGCGSFHRTALSRHSAFFTENLWEKTYGDEKFGEAAAGALRRGPT